MDDAEPMEDAEAEAVLRVLGEQLTWEQTGSSTYDEWMAERQKPIASVYIITVWKRSTVPAPKFEAQLLFDPEEVKTYHATLADAKAACERHYATGKWE